MINHARTLLLNRHGAGYGGRPGDEYIPPEFREISPLPGYLQNLRSQLFGSDPDWFFLNYRVRQCLGLLHSTELAEFVVALDPRITYDLTESSLLPDSLYELTTPDESIYVIGKLGLPDRYGRAAHSWKLTDNDGEVEVARLTKPVQTVTQSYTVDGGLSSPIALVGSDAAVRIRPQSGRVWRLSGYARPQASLGQLAAAVAGSSAVYMNALFGIGTASGAAEPWLTFRNLWYDHPELAYKLGGLLLAVIYRMEERRTNA